MKQVNVTPDQADLQVTSKLRNGGRGQSSAAVTCELLDAGGAVLQSVHDQASVDAGGNADAVNG